AAAEHREVMAVDGDRAAVHRADAGDDPVAVGPVALDAEVVRAVPGELVELHERALVEQQVDPLAGGELALGVLLLNRCRRSGMHGLVPAALQVSDLPRRRMQIRQVVRNYLTRGHGGKVNADDGCAYQ